MSVIRTDPVATAPLVAGGSGEDAGSVLGLGADWAGDAGGETGVLWSGILGAAGAAPAAWPAAVLSPTSVWSSENQNGAPWDTRPMPRASPNRDRSHITPVSHGAIAPLQGC